MNLNIHDLSDQVLGNMSTPKEEMVQVIVANTGACLKRHIYVLYILIYKF